MQDCRGRGVGQAGCVRYSDNKGTERPPCPRCVHFDGEKRLKCRGRVDKDKCQHFDVDGRAKEEEKNKKKRVDTSGNAMRIGEDDDVITKHASSHNKKARYNNTHPNNAHQSICLPQKLQESAIIHPLRHFDQMQIGYCSYLSKMLENKHALFDIQCVLHQVQMQKERATICKERDTLSQLQAELCRKLDNLLDLDIENCSFGSAETTFNSIEEVM